VHIESAQGAFSRYWEALREVLEVPEPMAELFTNNNGEVEVVAGGAGGYRLVYDTIRELDKANLHRFFEYAIEQIHFWSHPCWLGELTLERAHQRLKTVLRKSNKKQEHILMMNAMRFNDWQGRLTGLYNIGAPTLQLPFRECASLLSGVRDNGSPAAIEDAASIASIAQLLHPAGVVAKELRLQEQHVYGYHGIYCNDADAYTFQLSPKRTALPSHAFGNIAENAPPILAALGQPFDADNQARYALRIIRSCRCPRRKIVITTGDIAVKQAPQPAPENAPPTYEQMLFFIHDPAENNSFRYVARPGTVSIPDENLRRYFTPTVPFTYSLELITAESTFIATVHACAEEDCVTSVLGNIIHSLTENGADRFLLLESSSAFPPRKG